MAGWWTYTRMCAVVGGLMLVPIAGFGGQQSKAPGDQSPSGQSQAQERDQQAEQGGGQGQQQYPSPYEGYSASQMQQIGKHANRNGTVTIDKAIQQAQAQANGQVVAADLGYLERPQESPDPPRGSQRGGGRLGGQIVKPVWQVQIINPEEGRLTLVLVDAQNGEVRNVQEYPLVEQMQ